LPALGRCGMAMRGMSGESKAACIAHWGLCAAWAVYLALVHCALVMAPVFCARVSAQASEYEELIDQASVAYREHRFEQARDLFEQAHVLQPSARTLRGLGLTAFALNHHTQARPELEAALADPRKPLPPEQRRELNAVLAWMKLRLGTLRLELEPAHALALVDEQAATAGSNLFELGEHALTVRASGYVTHEQRFVLERDVPLELRIDMRPQPPAAAVIAAVTAAPGQLPQAQPQPMAAARDEPPAEAASGGLLSRWWFWTIAGIVVATTTVAIVVATHEPEPQPLPPGMVLLTQ
jgi:tetratricopeptide (TPR) repeat protein